MKQNECYRTSKQSTSQKVRKIPLEKMSNLPLQLLNTYYISNFLIWKSTENQTFVNRYKFKLGSKKMIGKIEERKHTGKQSISKEKTSPANPKNLLHKSIPYKGSH